MTASVDGGTGEDGAPSSREDDELDLLDDEGPVDLEVAFARVLATWSS